MSLIDKLNTFVDKAIHEGFEVSGMSGNTTNHKCFMECVANMDNTDSGVTWTEKLNKALDVNFSWEFYAGFFWAMDEKYLVLDTNKSKLYLDGFKFGKDFIAQRK